MEFSVVITLRNEASTVKPLIESLLNQSLKPTEIIIVDGQSSDNTQEIIEPYRLAKQVILLVLPCNIAQGRNAGIKAASCPYIAITDGGCQVDPDWLKSLSETYLADPSTDVVAGNYRLEYTTPFEQLVALATMPPNFETSDTATDFPSSRSVAFKKSIWQQAGGYPDWLYAAEDTLLNIKLHEINAKFSFSAAAKVYWRPRVSWYQLAKQQLQYARGNARIGFASQGYLNNLQYHAAFIGCLLLSTVSPLLLLLALYPITQQIRHHLWPHAKACTSHQPSLRLRCRIMTVMEWVRIFSILGFLLGRLDRLTNPMYINKLTAWLGRNSVE